VVRNSQQALANYQQIVTLECQGTRVLLLDDDKYSTRDIVCNRNYIQGGPKSKPLPNDKNRIKSY